MKNIWTFCLCLFEQVIRAFRTEWYNHTVVIIIIIISSSMSVHQQPAADEQSSARQRPTQCKTRFTIDSILDTSSSSAHHAKDDGKSVPALIVQPSDDQPASATDSGAALDGSATNSQNADEECSPQTTIYHQIGEDLERSVEGSRAAKTEQRSVAECSSLLARTAAEFQRRHQQRVVQLRSFSELLFAQYEEYQHQLRNQFRHQHQHSALTPPGRNGSLPPDAVRTASSAMQWSPVDRVSSPLPTSSVHQHRASRHASHISAEQLQQPATFQLDANTNHYRASTSTASHSRIHNGSEAHHQRCSIGDYNRDNSNRTKWTAASTNNIGIFIVALSQWLLFYIHTRLKTWPQYTCTNCVHVYTRTL